jgi:hypothetical protein
VSLLDPKNDFVFKKLFADAPDLLAALINAVRPDETPITVVVVLNPRCSRGQVSHYREKAGKGVRALFSRLNAVNLAGLFVQDVRASVLPNMSGEKVLLGMSDLERLEAIL